MTLKARSINQTKKRYCFVDVPDEVREYIPREIIADVRWGTHLLKDTFPFSNEYAVSRLTAAKKLLDSYCNNAAVVVTGRLHCASPCIAMGIPVIIIKKNRDTNIGWIERFTNIYLPDQYLDVDWYPESSNNETIKEKMKNSIISMIEVKRCLFPHYDLSYELEDSLSDQVNEALITKLDRIVKIIGKKNFKYAIWGLGDGGAISYRLIRERYAEAKCEACIDSFKTGDFYGMNILNPSHMKEVIGSVDFVFLTTYTGRKMAVKLLEELGLITEVDYDFLLSRVNGEDEYFKF